MNNSDEMELWISLQRQRLPNLHPSRQGWKHPMFNAVRRLQEEHDEYLRTPLEVVEGVLQCRCGSRNVISTSRQTRAGDEPMTTFAKCNACKKSWTSNY